MPAGSDRNYSAGLLWKIRAIVIKKWLDHEPVTVQDLAGILGRETYGRGKQAVQRRVDVMSKRGELRMGPNENLLPTGMLVETLFDRAIKHDTLSHLDGILGALRKYLLAVGRVEAADKLNIKATSNSDPDLWIVINGPGRTEKIIALTDLKTRMSRVADQSTTLFWGMVLAKKVGPPLIAAVARS